jgi:carboxyl-terminal processing protease
VIHYWELTLNKGTLLFLLTVLCTISSANSAETIWKTQGYGYVFHTLGKKTTVFDLTNKHCLENHFITSEFEQTAFIEETQRVNKNTRLLNFGGLFPLKLTKLVSLPAQCQSKKIIDIKDKNYKFNANIVFDVLMNNFEEHYAFTEDRNINWVEQRKLWQERITSKTTQDELFGIIDDFLKELRDGHAILLNQELDRLSHYSPRKWSFWNELKKHSVNYPEYSTYWELHTSLINKWQENIKNYFDSNFRTLQYHNNFTLAKTPQNIAYLKIDNFDDFSNNDVKATQEVMELFTPIIKGSKGLIIDLRFSMGGSDLVSNKILSYLIGKELLLGGKQFKTPDGFSSLQEIIISPSKFVNYTGDIVVLTSQQTPSAAEAFLLGLQARDGVTFIGERSYGAFSDALTKALPNGWGITLSNERYLNFQGHNYESVGLPVDKNFEFLNIENIEHGIDLQLNEAIKTLL